MNTVREIQRLNERELKQNISPEASWHTDYRDTAWIYIGGFPYTLSEGDVLTIFSQYGEPTHLNLARDRDTGESKGFAFLKYEDQRSCDLAVDNLGGVTVGGRTLRVDHTRYKMKDGEHEEDYSVRGKGNDESEEKKQSDNEVESEEERPLIKEEIELQKLIREYDDEDPMKEYLVKEKEEEVAQALAKSKDSKHAQTDRHHHRHRHHHRKKSPEDAKRIEGEGDVNRHEHRRRRDGSDYEDYRKRRKRDEATPGSRDRHDHGSDSRHRREYHSSGDRHSSKKRDDDHTH